MFGWFLALVLAVAAEDPGVAWVRAAVEAHPARAADLAAADAASDRASVAGRWADPVASLSYTGPFSTGWIGDHPMAGIDARLSQRLMPPAWSSVRREAGEADAAARVASAEATAASLSRRLHAGWWAVARARARAEALAAHGVLAAQARDAARARVSVGRAPEAAALRLDLLVLDLTQAVEDARGVAAQAAAAVEAMAGAPLPDPGPTLPEGVPRWPVPTDTAAPVVVAAAARAEAAEARSEAARAERGVPVELFVGVRGRTFQSPTDPGVDLFTAGLAVPVPVSRGATARAEAAAWSAQARASDAEAQAASREVAAAVAGAQAAFDTAAASLAALEADRLPAVRAWRDAALAGFETGRASAQDVYEAERDLVRLTLEHVDLRAALWSLRTDVIALRGGEEGP